MSDKNPLITLAQKRTLRIVGLMSGTSADGVDAAIIDMRGRDVRLIAQGMFPYPAPLRKSIFRLFDTPMTRADDICHFNFALGEVFSQAVIKLCKKARVSLRSIDLVGSHGQTIYHNPDGRRFGKQVLRSTLQIVEPAVIAQRLGITTVADFRPGDIAVGGQGAPLVPYADYVLFADAKRDRAVQNIGGIANVTYLPARCRPEKVIAFDTGPGNMIIDRITSIMTRGKQIFDRGGILSARGSVNTSLLKQLLAHPFFRVRPPKSTGREQFGCQFADDLFKTASKKGIPTHDILTTATAFTAETIARAYQRFLPTLPVEMILCGGGSHNRTLINMLQSRLPRTKIVIMDKFGIPADAKEAVSFAILACAAVKGLPNNIPTATGAKKPVILGKIVPVQR